MSSSLTRRQFIRLTAGSAIVVTFNPGIIMKHHRNESSTVRLGGPLFTKFENPDEWINIIKTLGYRAVYCPLDISAGPDEIKAYKKAAKKADIIISEVGVWNN